MLSYSHFDFISICIPFYFCSVQYNGTGINFWKHMRMEPPNRKGTEKTGKEEKAEERGRTGGQGRRRHGGEKGRRGGEGGREEGAAGGGRVLQRYDVCP